jgi:phage shock protein C
MARGLPGRDHVEHEPRLLPLLRPSRLTRSSTDRKIGGVAGGVAAYFGVDPLLVRIGFAVTTLFSGAGMVAYLVMLALVPRDDAVPSPAHPAAA